MQNSVPQVHQLRQADPFWWASVFTVLVVFISLGAAFAIAPVFVYIKFQQSWQFLLFLLIPFGFWMMWYLTRKLAELVWENRHRSRYILEKDRIHFEVWDRSQAKQLCETEMPFSDISYAAITMYVLENNHFYARSRFFEHVPQTAVLPMLSVITEKNGTLHAQSIPFYYDSNLNPWLETLKEHQIPLYFSAVPLPLQSQEARDAFFKENDWLIPFEFEKSWMLEDEKLFQKWEETFHDRIEQETELTEEEELAAEEILAQIEQGKKARRKAALLAYALVIAGNLVVVELGRKQIIPSDSLLPGLAVFLPIAFLYFFKLKEHLTLKHLFSYWLVGTGLSFIILLFYLDTPLPAEDTAAGFVVSGLFSIAVLWIPYWIARQRTKKNRQASA